MFVCLCHGVSDKKIKALVASGVRDLRQITAVCNAGGDCGKCVCELRRIINESKSSEPGNASTETKASRAG